jgi:type II secretion system protein N
VASPTNILEAPIPRPLLWIGAPVAAIVLIAVFVFLRFPYDEFAVPLGQQLSAMTGSDVTIGGIDPRLTIGGPGVAARNVRITTPDGRWIEIDPLRIRPAWSTAWLRGDPALKVELESGVGRSEGLLVLGDSAAWRGEVVDVDLARLPLRGQAIVLAGRLEAAADLLLAPGGPIGPLSFDASAGSIAHPAIPIPLEFERATGDIALGDDPVVHIRSFEIDGPVLFASVSGDVRRGQRRGDEQLDLGVKLEIKDPALVSLLQSFGVRLDARGRAQFDLGGTLSNPRPR